MDTESFDNKEKKTKKEEAKNEVELNNNNEILRMKLKEKNREIERIEREKNEKIIATKEILKKKK